MNEVKAGLRHGACHRVLVPRAGGGVVNEFHSEFVSASV